jgi:hypothetical protein
MTLRVDAVSEGPDMRGADNRVRLAVRRPLVAAATVVPASMSARPLRLDVRSAVAGRVSVVFAGRRGAILRRTAVFGAPGMRRVRFGLTGRVRARLQNARRVRVVTTLSGHPATVAIASGF